MVGVESQPPGARLHGDAAEAVAEEVVQVAGDAQALLHRGVLGDGGDPGPSLPHQLGRQGHRDSDQRRHHPLVGPAEAAEVAGQHPASRPAVAAVARRLSRRWAREPRATHAP